MAGTNKTVQYIFKLDNGVEKRFAVRLRHPTMQLVSIPPTNAPVWTHLTTHQCPNCPLDPKKHPHCPIALNLTEVIDLFKDSWSIQTAEVIVSITAREYRKTVPLPVGVSSLIGLYMVTSGCPIMDKLRPMVHTHLPFATVEETMYRSISMYLLAQFFRHKRGETADWELKDLVRIYDSVNQVNHSFCKRLGMIKATDASLNALSGLDCFASITALSIMENTLHEMEALFHAYREVSPTKRPGPQV